MSSTESPSSSSPCSSWSERPLPALVRLAWPIAVSMISFSAMSMVDLFFVGRISAAAIAGVGIGSLLAFTLACFGIGLLRATKTAVAAAIGAQRAAQAWPYLGAALALGGAWGGVCLVAALPTHAILPAIAGSTDAGIAASAYFAVRVLSLPLLLGYVATRETAYGLGLSRAPMVATLFANLINAGLDALFILRLGLGPAGAAWASLIAQGAELGLLWLILAPPWRQLRFGRRHLRELVRLGLPSGIQFVIEVGSFTLTGLLIASMSKIEMAGHQIALQILHMCFLPAQAIGEAGAVLVGQAVGAGRHDLVVRVARQAIAAAMVYTALFSLGLLVSGGAVATLFTADERVAAIGSLLLVFSVSFLTIDGAAIASASLLRGTGDVSFVAVWSVIVAWVCTPTGALVLGHWAGLGALGAWIGIAAELTLIAVLFWTRLNSGRWQLAAERTRVAALEATA